MSEYVHLRLVPTSQQDVRRYIAETHRHNDAPLAAQIRMCVGIEDDEGKLRGVAVLGRPVARMLDDGRTAEVQRVATDGVKNGASMLYGACLRAAWAMGYDRVFTYTLEDEPGTSLRAAGWTEAGVSGGGSWDRPNGNAGNHQVGAESRPTMFFEAKHPTGRKIRWVIERKDRAA